MIDSRKRFVDHLVAVSSLMNATALTKLETRLHRVERQNRILVALMGATKRSGNVITADEVRTQRLSLINERGNVVHEWVVHGGMLIEQ
jgi:hypothetical protein